MKTKEALIDYIHQIYPVSGSNAELIAEGFQLLEIPRAEMVLKEGHVCKSTYFIETGIIRSYTINTQGEEISTAFYSAPSFATDFVSFFRRTPSKENFHAISECKIWYLSYEAVQSHYHTMPEFREFGRLLLIHNYALLQQRSLELIQLTAEQRYSNLLKDYPEIGKLVPLKYIASYLGITDSSLSRIRASFKK